MNVYVVKRGRPLTGKWKEFATLIPKRTDANMLRTQLGKGEPVFEWRKIELYIFNPAAPRPDFFFLGLECVCNQQARDIVGSLLEEGGELLPVTIEGASGVHYLYNCTKVVDALDPNRSIWEFFKQTGDSNLAVPSFFSSRLQGEGMFKYPKDLAAYMSSKKAGIIAIGSSKP
jgi:hypothetical protein